jgi:myosin heavy subunit
MARDHPAFAIEHFAGVVEYSAATFLEKNRDNLAPNIVDLMQECSVSIVKDVFLGEILHTGQIRPKLRSANTVRCRPDRSSKSCRHRAR